MTQNYVSSANLPQVLDFLKGGRTELVSGCPFEQRGRLHDAFVFALHQQRPQVRSILLTQPANVQLQGWLSSPALVSKLRLLH